MLTCPRHLKRLLFILSLCPVTCVFSQRDNFTATGKIADSANKKNLSLFPVPTYTDAFSMPSALPRQIRLKANQSFHTIINQNRIKAAGLHAISLNGISIHQPSVYSPALSQGSLNGIIEVGGIQSQLKTFENFSARGTSLFDFSFKLNPAAEFKKLASSFNSTYKGALNTIVLRELEKLKAMRQQIEAAIGIEIDSLVDNSGYTAFINMNNVRQLNFETLISRTEDYEAMLETVEKNDANKSFPEYAAFKARLKKIESYARSYRSLKIDSLTAKYEELIAAGENKQIQTPADLKRLVKQNGIKKFRLNWLLWAKNIELGNIFHPGSPRNSKGDKFNLGNISQGAGFVLNNKTNLKIFLGRNITGRFDRFLHTPDVNGYLARTEGLNKGNLNAEVSIADVAALGGISASYNQTGTSHNAVNSFFGLNRITQRFSLSKKVVIGSHEFSLLASTSSLSYVQNENSWELSGLEKTNTSVEVDFSYSGYFSRLDLLASGTMGGTLGQKNITSSGSYDHPGFYADFNVRKSFREGKYSLSSVLNISNYRMGISASDNFATRSSSITGKINFNPKHSIDISIREYFSGNHGSFQQRSYGVIVSHQAFFKKNALQYRFITSGSIRQNQSITGNVRGKGLISELSGNFSLLFPGNFGISNTTTYSSNSYTNLCFLQGKRITVSPGVIVNFKNVNYTGGVLYESVKGFYKQAGIRNSIVLREVLHSRLSLNLSVDARYNIEQRVMVFNNRLVSFGGAGISYTLK